MEFTPDRAKQATEILFSYNKDKVAHPLITFNGQHVAKVEEKNTLGLSLTEISLLLNTQMLKLSKPKKILGLSGVFPSSCC